MKTIRCEFCHKDIPSGQYKQHVAEHTKLRDDGQLTDYATLPESERSDDNSVASAPRWYQHSRCGGVTGMPEEIIATYLQDPWFYSSDETYCCGCQNHVPNSECTWTETGQNLQEYMDGLREGIPRPGCFGIIAFLTVSLGVAWTIANAG